MAFSIDLSFDDNEQFDIEFGLDNYYEETYKPVPSVEEQILHTANKQMLEDIVIQPIPINRVPSPDNKGYTVIIG